MRLLFGIAAVLVALVVGGQAFVSHRISHYPNRIPTWKAHMEKLQRESHSPEELKEKVIHFHSTLTEDRQDFTTYFQTKCTSWIEKVANKEEQAKLKALYAEKDNKLLAEKIREHVARLPEEKRGKAHLWLSTCAHLSKYADLHRESDEPKIRVRRSAYNHDLLEIDWLSNDQKSEIFSHTDNAPQFNKQYLSAFNALPHDERKNIAHKIVKKCYGWLSTVATTEEIAELKELHHTNHEQCKTKVKEYLGRLDEEQRTSIEKHLDVCESIWYNTHTQGGHEHHHRRRRDHESYTLEAYLKTHLSWLTSEQAEELKKMKADGKPVEELEQKVFEYFDAAEGETKAKAKELLQGGCRELIKSVIGEEKANEVKTLKESGASTEDLAKKVDEFVAEVTDEKKKELVKKYHGACKRVFGVASRKRRDHHHGGHILDDYLKTHLSWLTSEQAEELKKMKADGKSAEELQKKVFEYYDAAEGETKTKATELLQGGCRELITHIVGEEKANEIKTLKESGASTEDLAKKVDEFVSGVTDDHKKELVKKYHGACKRVFGVASRKRRDHHHGGHTLEDYLKTHLSWLTSEQAEELKKMKADGKPAEELQKKVFEYYDAAEGETKTKATELLQGGCRELIKSVIGEEKAGELKKLKESGASTDDLKAKVEELLGAVTDPEKQAIAKKYESACKRVFNINSSRKRRHDGHNDLEDFINNHLTWLTPEQLAEINKVKETEGRSGVEKKTQMFYEQTTGETRVQATAELQESCRELTEEILGDKYSEITELKKSGASKEDIYNKVEELFAGVTDEEKKKKGEAYKDGCKKLFGLPSRKRRDHHHGSHTLEDYLKTHLSWLTSEQAEELKKMKADGKPAEELQKKVFEYYDAAEGETKTKATELLQGGCRELITHIVGEEKANEIKTLKESGASTEDLAKKVDEFVSGVTDDHKKELVKKYHGACKRVFGVASRKRRDHHVPTLEDFFKTHLAWLTTEQQEELKKMKEENKTPDEIQKKVFEFYDATEGETRTKATELLQGGCRELLKKVVGEEKAGELKQLKESGASTDDIKAKVKEFLETVTDPKKLEIVKKYESGCKRVFNVESSRKRRHEDDESLEGFAKNHLTWLTAEQTEELLKLKDSPKETIKAKVKEFFDATTGETRVKAVESFKGACRELMAKVIGSEKTAEVKQMKESGTSFEDIEKKVDEWIAAVTDEKKKQLAKEHVEECKKIFKASEATSRRRRDHHHGSHTLDDYLKTHLSWLTSEQAEELKKLKADGKSAEELQKKVFEYYNAAEGETKTKATELLQGGCRELIKSVIGEEKANEVKTLKESGATNDELAKKVDEFVSAVTDEKKKELAKKYSAACKRVFGVESTWHKTHVQGGHEHHTHRRRRDHHHHGGHTLEDYLKTHLSWLTSEQAEELKKMKADGKPAEELQKKVFEYYDAAEGETKTKATELLKGGCRELITHIVGEEKANEIKTLKESGASTEDLAKKVDEFVSGVTDDHKKELVKKYHGACKRVFGVASRKRRDEPESFTLESYLKTYLNWLTSEQAEELKKMKADGKSVEEIGEKVFEYYDAAEGEAKAKATELLQGGCRELIKKVVGEEKAGELKKLKESGASTDDIKAKVKEFLEAVTDPEKQALAKKYEHACKRVFGVSDSRKRRALKPVLTHLDFMKAVVMNEDLPELSHRELSFKIMDIYDAQTYGENSRVVVNQCHHLFAEVVVLNFYMDDNSARELLHSLRSASNRQLKTVGIIAEVCTRTLRELEKTEGRYGSVGDTLVTMFNNLDDETRARLGHQWRSKCIDWVLEVTDDEERGYLKMLLRTKQFEPLRERVNEFISRFDDSTKTQVGHMRPICEELLEVTSTPRKSFKRTVPLETVF